MRVSKWWQNCHFWVDYYFNFTLTFSEDKKKTILDSHTTWAILCLTQNSAYILKINTFIQLEYIKLIKNHS